MTNSALSRFPGLFETVRANTNPKKTFASGKVRLTYGELFDSLGQTSAFFKEIGLKVGDRAVICTANEREATVLYLATLQCGLTAVFIDPRGSVSETVLLLEAADPAVIFMDEKLLSDVDSSTSARDIQLFRIKDAETKPVRKKFGLLLGKKAGGKKDGDEDSLQARVAKQGTNQETLGEVPEETTALILFTSGTTSRPKGVELSFKNIYAQFVTFKSQYRLDENSRVMNHLPMHHTDGLALAPGICLFCSATWIRPPGLTMNTLGEILDQLYQEDATHFVSVPTVLGLVYRAPAEYDDAFSFSNFRFVISTAGYLEEKLWADFEKRFSTMIVNSYGLTETVSEALYCGPDNDTRKLGTIGKPRDCEAKVANDDGVEVANGTVGELLLRGDNIMKGYFSNPEATAEVFVDGWFRSGDLAIQDNDGFFSIAGRKKNLIIRAGINVYPDDVTHCITELVGVLDAVTFGLPDSIMGEKVVSCVTLDGSQELSVQNVVDHCREHLAYEKVPNDIHILDKLPRGPAGKVLLKEIKAQVQKIEEVDEGENVGSVPDQVLQVASSVFNVPMNVLSPSSSDQTTEGWDSLSHLELVVALEAHFSIKMGPRDIMNMSSLGNVINIIEDKLA